MSYWQKFRILFRKEMTFILRDRKTLVTNILLTVIITPALFMVINLIQQFQTNQVEATELMIGVKLEDRQDPYAVFLDAQDKITVVEVPETEQVAKLKEGEITAYLQLEAGEKVLNVTYVFDERSNISTGAVAKIQILTEAYKASLRATVLATAGLSEADINPVAVIPNSVQRITGEVSQSSMVLFLLPYIIMVALMQGALQYAIEMTAGEKERNTLATTLSMNAPSQLIALAKIATTLVFSVVVMIANLVSIAIAFNLMPDQAFSFTLTPAIIGQLVLVLLPLSFLTSSGMILLGIFARNQKEAGVYAAPLLLSAVFIGFAGNAFDASSPIVIFLVPLLGHVVALKQILLGAFTPLAAAVLVGMTLTVFVAIIALTVAMFRREEVLFRQ
jgi:sodium transport system permease protein